MQFFAEAGRMGCSEETKRFKMRSASLCASSAERIFIISRLSRSAERSKRIFTGGVITENGSCCACSPGGAVAQRLRGFRSAEPEKTVKRSSRRTGVNLQFFPVQPSSLGLKGASSPFFVAPARRNRWHFSGSLLVSKENIPGSRLWPSGASLLAKGKQKLSNQGIKACGCD